MGGFLGFSFDRPQNKGIETDAQWNVARRLPNHGDGVRQFGKAWFCVQPPYQAGLLKRYILQPFETCCFFHQNKGKPPFTSCNVQVYDASGSLSRGTKAQVHRPREYWDYENLSVNWGSAPRRCRTRAGTSPPGGMRPPKLLFNRRYLPQHTKA